MSSITLEEAQTKLAELLARLQPGEEIIITEHGEPLAQVKKAERTSWPCRAGSAKGKLRMAPDFDAPLDEFREYIGVNLLLDTHALLWFLDDNPLLSAAAKALIEEPANRKFVSVATCWEIAIKVGLKKLDLGEPASIFLPRELMVNHFDLLGIELRHATLVETLPQLHKDPFDRLLIAQSKAEAMPIVGVDAAFDSYGVRRLW